MYYIQERWKIIEGTDGRYSISDHGRLRHERTGRVWRGSPNSKGYRVLFWRSPTPTDSRHRSCAAVHRLVALAFVEGFVEGLDINHKDGIKHNNIWTNLEWVTRSENVKHAYQAGLHPKTRARRPNMSARDKAEAYSRVVDRGESQRSVALSIGRAESTISLIVNAPRPVVPQESPSLFDESEK